jgi:neutral trehalase
MIVTWEIDYETTRKEATMYLELLEMLQRVENRDFSHGSATDFYRHLNASWNSGWLTEAEFQELNKRFCKFLCGIAAQRKGVA